MSVATVDALTSSIASNPVITPPHEFLFWWQATGSKRAELLYRGALTLEPIRKEVELVEWVVIPWWHLSCGRGASCGSRNIERRRTVVALRYESDLTDAEWALVGSLIPPAKRGGRPRTVNVREVLNAIFYVLWTGCQWKALPKDLPPRSTVWEYLDLWDWDGTLGRIHHALYVEVREQAGREASPTTAIIDSQTAKGAVKGGFGSTRPAMTLARRCLAASATS